MGMLEAELMFVERPKVMSKVAFSAGSSRQGNAWRASVGWNWVAASHLLGSDVRLGQNGAGSLPATCRPRYQRSGQIETGSRPPRHGKKGQVRSMEMWPGHRMNPVGYRSRTGVQVKSREGLVNGQVMPII